MGCSHRTASAKLSAVVGRRATFLWVMRVPQWPAGHSFVGPGWLQLGVRNCIGPMLRRPSDEVTEKRHSPCKGNYDAVARSRAAQLSSEFSYLHRANGAAPNSPFEAHDVNRWRRTAMNFDHRLRAVADARARAAARVAAPT